MRQAVFSLSTACCLLLAGCAATEPADVVRGTAAFLVVAASQDEYVQACEARGNSSLECHAAYDDTRKGHQAYYQSQKKQEEQKTAEVLSAELDEYFESAGNDPRPD